MGDPRQASAAADPPWYDRASAPAPLNVTLAVLAALLVVGVLSAVLDWSYWPTAAVVIAVLVPTVPIGWASAKKRGVLLRSEEPRGTGLIGVVGVAVVVSASWALPDRWWGLFVFAVWGAFELVWRALWRGRDRIAGAPIQSPTS
jgi:hypothetical protein